MPCVPEGGALRTGLIRLELQRTQKSLEGGVVGLVRTAPQAHVTDFVPHHARLPGASLSADSTMPRWT